MNCYITFVEEADGSVTVMDDEHEVGKIRMFDDHAEFDADMGETLFFTADLKAIAQKMEEMENPTCEHGYPRGEGCRGCDPDR